MSYKRVVGRNFLNNGYWNGIGPTPCGAELARLMISGDMRRLEKDNLDEYHLKCYSEACNVSIEQAKAVLEMFFSGDVTAWHNAPKTNAEKYPTIAWSVVDKKP